MAWNKEVGDEGERRACAHLAAQGYGIVGANVRVMRDEIDIVAVSPDGTLVFVEVKTVVRAAARGLAPEDQLTAAKLRKCARAAQWYANAHPELVDERKGWRLDAVVLEPDAGGFALRHYKNV